jgi:hypothetical protein
MPRIRDELRALDTSARALRRFGMTVGTALLLLGVLFLCRHRLAGWPLAILGVVLLLVAVIAPTRLTAVHRVWMTLAIAMGWVMTNVILTIVFFLVLTPLGLLQRLFAKPSLDLAFKAGESSYWATRSAEGRSLADYEKQY